MSTANTQTMSGWNLHALFNDENSASEESKKTICFFDDTAGTPTSYTQRNIAHIFTLLVYAKHFTKMYEEANFFSFLDTRNIRDTSKYLFIPESMLPTSHIPAPYNSQLRVESLFNDLISIRPLFDFSSFESIQIALKNLGFRESAERIKYLRLSDDIEDDESLSLESAQGFVQLMENFQDLGEPMLGLFDQGTLSVEWRIANDKHLLVEPLDNEHACFAFIGPSTEQGEKLRLNGRGRIVDVIDTLRKEGVDQWQQV